MKPAQLAKYLEKQRKIIELEKWNRGIELNCDPGQEFVADWVAKNASKFRKKYTTEELVDAQKEIDDMKRDLDNSVVDLRKLKKYLEDIQDKIDMAKETLEDKNE